MISLEVAIRLVLRRSQQLLWQRTWQLLAAFVLGGAFSTSIFAAEGLRVAFGPKNVQRVRAIFALVLQLVIALPPTAPAAHPPGQGHPLGPMREPSPLRGRGEAAAAHSGA